MTSDPVVLFIGGYGRSGSTLLDRLVGGYGEGVVSAGEVRHLWREGMLENRRCGCGEPFHDCAFWRAVLREAFGPGGPPPVEALLALQSRVDRSWRIPQLARAGSSGSGSFARDAARYRQLLADVHRAIATVAGARVVVDSTKDPSHGWLLHGAAGIDLRVVQLTRDPRAVAWSWQRRRHHPGNDQDMNRFHPARTAVGWLAVDALVGALRHRGMPSLVARYEDLVARPDVVVGDILELVGSDRRPAAALGRGRAELRPDHTVAGNPIRFTHGEITLASDDEWRSKMPVASRALVTAITAVAPAARHHPRRWASVTSSA